MTVTLPAGVPPVSGLTAIASCADCSWPNCTVAVFVARVADAAGDSTDTMACSAAGAAITPPVTQFSADQQDTVLCRELRHRRSDRRAGRDHSAGDAVLCRPAGHGALQRTASPAE